MKKRLRQSVKHAARNRTLKAKVKTARRAVVDNLSQATPEETATNLSAAYKAFDKAAKRGIMKPKTAARRKSRLAKRVAKAQ